MVISLPNREKARQTGPELLPGRIMDATHDFQQSLSITQKPGMTSHVRNRTGQHGPGMGQECRTLLVKPIVVLGQERKIQQSGSAVSWANCPDPSCPFDLLRRAKYPIQRIGEIEPNAIDRSSRRGAVLNSSTLSSRKLGPE
jgi:hypothetical protein